MDALGIELKISLTQETLCGGLLLHRGPWLYSCFFDPTFYLWNNPSSRNTLTAAHNLPRRITVSFRRKRTTALLFANIALRLKVLSNFNWETSGCVLFFLGRERVEMDLTGRKLLHPCQASKAKGHWWFLPQALIKALDHDMASKAWSMSINNMNHL